MENKKDKKAATAAAFKQMIMEHYEVKASILPEEFLDSLTFLLADAFHIGYEAGREAERKQKEDQTC